MSTRDHRLGFTIIELMVSLTLGTVVIGMLLQVASITISGLGRQREALEIERNARAAIDLLAEAVRNASPGVPSGDVTDATFCNAVTAIRVANRADGPDAIDLISAIGGIVTSTRTTVDASSTNLTVVDAQAIRVGDLVVVADGTTGRLVPVTSVTATGSTHLLGTQTGRCAGAAMPAAGFAPGALVIRSRFARVAIVDDADGVPNLILDSDGDGPADPELLADSVEDLQIAIGVDIDGDGALRDTGDVSDEWFYNAAGDPDPPSITGGGWRALRITVTVRDRKRRGDSARPAAEDRPAGAVDTYQRRTLRTEIQIRNLGGLL